MNSPIETGLFLPIRFYNTLAEQNRFKRISEGVSTIDEIYIYADCKYLLPFQIVFFQDEVTVSIDWKLICTDTEEETILPFNAANWETYFDGTYEWVSYLGTEDLTGLVANGRYYFQVDITNSVTAVSSYYSDVFVIRNCNSYYTDTNYRLTTPDNNNKRSIDITDLRITTNI